MIIVKYKFDHTLEDLLPVFNDDFIEYSIIDEVNQEDNTTIRRIDSEYTPSQMLFRNSKYRTYIY